MRLLIIVSGSIAIKKSSELIKDLKKKKIEIDFLITRSALSIIHSLKILTIIGLVIFAGRNVNRIINEAKIYNYNPIQNAYFRLENIKFRQIIIKIHIHTQ